MEFKTFCKNSHTTYCEFKPEHELFRKFYEIINQQQEMILSISEVFLGDIGRLISNNFLEQDWIFGKNHADRLTRNMVRDVKACLGNVTVSELAGRMEYSRHYINEVFRRDIGMSLNKYMQLI